MAAAWCKVSESESGKGCLSGVVGGGAAALTGDWSHTEVLIKRSGYMM